MEADMKKLVTATLLFCLSAAPVLAKTTVVATLPWIGSVASDIGKDRIDVTTLVKPNQDPHSIEAKPSMILAARKADIIMYNGLDLEIGYLPVLIESSKNPKIQAGKPGNLDCSRYVTVIEKPTSVDRSMGDVHPLGNPHYVLSPSNVGKVAEGVVRALSQVDPVNGDFYRSNGDAFQTKLRGKIDHWTAIAPRGRKYIAYHHFFEYLAREFGFQIVGYIEEKPGIPPSAAHIERVLDLLRQGKADAIISTGFYERRAPEYLSQKAGVRVLILPHDVGSTTQAKDWFGLMDSIFDVIK
jgi:zinc/manganese transport system substrate-binding protein